MTPSGDHWAGDRALDAKRASHFRRAVVFAAAAALGGCGGGGGGTPIETCVPTCSSSTSCRNTCGGLTCPCPSGDVCDPSGACRPCVAGSCAASPADCFDECGNADPACTSYCARPDVCTDQCGVSGSPACAGVECDPLRPGECLDTCGQYAAPCCCAPTICATPSICADDCGSHDPYLCAGQACGAACEDTCGEPDANCWVTCADPTYCQDDCGNYNATACAGILCDLDQPGFDTCGQLADGC